jgi:MFS-type transporter involved in bile tolerance (Atg22 family)
MREHWQMFLIDLRESCRLPKLVKRTSEFVTFFLAIYLALKFSGLYDPLLQFMNGNERLIAKCVLFFALCYVVLSVPVLVFVALLGGAVQVIVESFKNMFRKPAKQE